MLATATRTTDSPAKASAELPLGAGRQSRSGQNADWPLAARVADRPGDSHEREAEHTADRLERVDAQPPGGSVNGPVASSTDGRPLDPRTRDFFEARLGHDLSDVRIHDGPAANRAAAVLHAQAFTTGGDVYFNADRYDTRSRDGRRLLAHELAHVIQQRQVPGAPRIQRQEEAGAPAPAVVTPEGQSDDELQQRTGVLVLLAPTVVTTSSQRWVSRQFTRVAAGRIVVDTNLTYPRLPVDCRPEGGEYYVTVRGTTNSGQAVSDTHRYPIGTSVTTIVPIPERGNYQVEVGVDGGCADNPFRLEVGVTWRS